MVGGDAESEKVREFSVNGAFIERRVGVSQLKNFGLVLNPNATQWDHTSSLESPNCHLTTHHDEGHHVNTLDFNNYHFGLLVDAVMVKIGTFFIFYLYIVMRLFHVNTLEIDNFHFGPFRDAVAFKFKFLVHFSTPFYLMLILTYTHQFANLIASFDMVFSLVHILLSLYNK